MNTASPGAPPPRGIAWAGVSFSIPSNWDMGGYRFRRTGLVRVELEDEYGVRAEVEWVRPRRPVDAVRLLERYEADVGKHAARAQVSQPVTGLPAGWTGTRHRFRERVPVGRHELEVREQTLVTGLYAAPDRGLVCYVLLHCVPGDPEQPDDLLRLLARDFRDQAGERAYRWQLFDLDVRIPAEFVLEATSFDIGAKLLVFRWRLRRFCLAVFSGADRFLRPGQSPEAWAAAWWNDRRLFPAVQFGGGTGGVVTVRRRRRYCVGHRDELSRACRRYGAHAVVDAARNQLVTWIFNHRRDEDLEILAGFGENECAKRG